MIDKKIAGKDLGYLFLGRSIYVKLTREFWEIAITEKYGYRND